MTPRRSGRYDGPGYYPGPFDPADYVGPEEMLAYESAPLNDPSDGDLRAWVEYPSGLSGWAYVDSIDPRDHVELRGGWYGIVGKQRCEAQTSAAYWHLTLRTIRPPPPSTPPAWVRERLPETSEAAAPDDLRPDRSLPTGGSGRPSW